MADVFISYVRSDRPIAEAISRELSALGLSTFFDAETIVFGNNVPKKIEENIQKSKLIIVIWSQQSSKSLFVREKIRVALEAWENQHLFLVSLDNADLPVGLRDIYCHEYSGTQFDKMAVSIASDVLTILLLPKTRAASRRPPSPSFAWKAIVVILRSLFRHGIILRHGHKDFGFPSEDTLFISYSRDDRPRVDVIARKLERSGLKIWLDTRREADAQRFATAIVQAIRASKACAFMCSSTAYRSDHVVRELYLADKYSKPMIPVEIETCAPSEDFEYFFSGLEFIPYKPVDRCVQVIIHQLQSAQHPNTTVP